MGDGDLELLLTYADHCGEPLYLAEDAHGRGLTTPPYHLDAIPLDEATAQSLSHGFFRGPAAGVVALGKAEVLAVGDLSFREEPLAYLRRPLEGELHPIDVHDVDAYPWHHEISYLLHNLHVTAE